METQKETKKHPAWKNAFDIVIKRLDEEGYGVLFSEKELLVMLDLEKPNIGTYSQFKDFSLEWMSQLVDLRNALLKEANVCLENKRGDGYMAMHPDDQIKKIAKKYFKHSRKKLNKAFDVLVNVDETALSFEGKQTQNDMLGRAAFIKQAMNKRKILSDGNKTWVRQDKQIEDK